VQWSLPKLARGAASLIATLSSASSGPY
jgi:hypothetical protein